MSVTVAAAILALSRSVMTGLLWCLARWQDQSAVTTDLTVILEHRPSW
jgi:hypothetical protein